MTVFMLVRREPLLLEPAVERFRPRISSTFARLFAIPFHLGDDGFLVVVHKGEGSKSTVDSGGFHVFSNFVHRYGRTEVTPREIPSGKDG